MCRGGGEAVLLRELNLSDICLKTPAARTKVSMAFLKHIDDNFCVASNLRDCISDLILFHLERN